MPSTAPSLRIIEKIAQLIGSMSSAVGSRPATVAGYAIQSAMWVEKTTPNSSLSPLACHGGSTSSTSCPSERSTSAASLTACAQIGSTTASGTGGCVLAAIRSLPGSPCAETAKGSDGGGAQVASPSS